MMKIINIQKNKLKQDREFQTFTILVFAFGSTLVVAENFVAAIFHINIFFKN